MAGTVAVVSDTTCCLSHAQTAAAGVALVDLDVVIDGEAAPESTLTTAQVAEAMRRRREVGTASPPPARFAAAYTAAVEAGASHIVSVHLSARASGTANVARIAAADIGAPVHVVDTGQLARATGAAVLAAAAAAADGRPADEVAEAARRTAGDCHTFFCVDDLAHLRRGGRLSVTQALIGSALSVKPLLVVRDGLVDVLEKVRTPARARTRLLAHAEQAVAQSGPAELHVHHVDDALGAQALAGHLTLRVPGVDVDVVEASPVISAHVGPGTLGIVVAPRCTAG